MCDDHQLEVPLRRALVNDVRQSGGEALDVLAVEVGGGLVQGDDAAVCGECLGQRQSDDEAGQHLLAGGAAAPHVQLSLVLDHDDAVAVDLPLVRPAAHGVVVRGPDLDPVDIIAFVSALPKLPNDLVNAIHLLFMKL